MPTPLIRWTIEKAAAEFAVDRKRLARKLHQADLEPSPDGRYSTKEILGAIFDDATSERTRLYREQADKLALENAKSRLETVDAETVYKAYEGIFIAMRKTILGSRLTDAEKAQACGQLVHDIAEPLPI
jgi:phage terminase Nu1 subunit (DNA packaging protein)